MITLHYTCCCVEICSHADPLHDSLSSLISLSFLFFLISLIFILRLPSLFHPIYLTNRGCGSVAEVDVGG